MEEVLRSILIAPRSKDQSKEGVNAAPDSPSRQLPEQISFFSGNLSVETAQYYASIQDKVRKTLFPFEFAYFLTLGRESALALKGSGYFKLQRNRTIFL